MIFHCDVYASFHFQEDAVEDYNYIPKLDIICLYNSRTSFANEILATRLLKAVKETIFSHFKH